METTTLTFEDAVIQITGRFSDGPEKKTYPGKIAVGTGLGYWIGEKEEGDDEPTFYVLTHIASGAKLVPLVIYDERVVQSFIEALAPLWDWNQSLEELANDPASNGIQLKVIDVAVQHVAQYPAAFGI